jgi:hypothetical protein
MDEESGTRVDSHGSHDLTDVNTVGFAAGKVSNAANFVRTNNEYFTGTPSAPFSPGDTDWTLAIWYYSLRDTTNRYPYIFVAGTAANEYSAVGVQHRENTNRIQGVMRCNNGNAILVCDNLGAVSNSQWYCLIMSWEASANTLKMETDDSVVDTLVYSSGYPNVTSDTILFGNRPNLSQSLNGYVDVTAFWSRLLTADEKTRFNAGMVYPG